MTAHPLRLQQVFRVLHSLLVARLRRLPDELRRPTQHFSILLSFGVLRFVVNNRKRQIEQQDQLDMLRRYSSTEPRLGMQVSQ